MPSVCQAPAKRRSRTRGTFGLRGHAGRIAYNASKRGLTKSAALEAGPYGIAVNHVCPGTVEGERFDRVRAGMADRLGITLARRVAA